MEQSHFGHLNNLGCHELHKQYETNSMSATAAEQMKWIFARMFLPIFLFSFIQVTDTIKVRDKRE